MLQIIANLILVCWMIIVIGFILWVTVVGRKKRILLINIYILNGFAILIYVCMLTILILDLIRLIWELK